MIHLVFQPIRETALTPVQEYRVTQIPPDRDIAQRTMEYNDSSDAVGEQMALNAFNVTPSANNRGSIVPNGTEQGCFHLRPPKSSAKNTKFTALTFQCVTNVLDARNLPDIPRSVTIAINFTQLVADMQQMRHIPLFLDSLGLE
ncbi:hypothetical protein D9613_006745 [Agrocybe pediades]|uniref:Uncharacterized protein n=1 Tax=Agrocybe pediades TaxID=84607 RepID=A0A8H4VIA6_9AGAR|nr:hypothetical protein D9613_006745 [Agrocybe pediades]